MKKILIILSIMFLTPHLYADDTSVFDNGHSVYPLDNSQIRMVSEKVTAKLETEDALFAGNDIIEFRVAHVTCEFLFKNTTHGEIKATLGFPVRKIGEVYSEDRNFDIFESYVDGKKTEVKIREGENDGNVWYIWDVIFPPSKTIKLENIYKTHLSTTGQIPRFEYVLTTGANWKGPIGHAVIEMVYDDAKDLKRRVRNVSPDGFKIVDKKIVWEFKNFTPSENIVVWEIPLFKVYSRLEDYLQKRKYEGNARFIQSMTWT